MSTTMELGETLMVSMSIEASLALAVINTDAVISLVTVVVAACLAGTALVSGTFSDEQAPVTARIATVFKTHHRILPIAKGSRTMGDNHDNLSLAGVINVSSEFNIKQGILDQHDGKADTGAVDSGRLQGARCQ